VKDAIKLRLMGRGTPVLSVSPALRADLVARGLPARQAHFVPNGIDLSRACGALRSRAEVRSSLGVRDDAPLILCFGWDPFRKGVDLALEAISMLAAETPRIVLALVGKPDMGEFVRERLPQGMPPWLRLVPPAESVADLYGAADVFLAPSREEGMPYSLAEAMANGLPVVASGIGGHEPYASAPGLVMFESGSAGALADAIRGVLSWPDALREENAALNRNFAQTHFSLEAWTRAMSEFYLRLPGISGADPDRPAPS
jgi:glycosyltransferase involved in cell wall biosynthesis